jgi:hypothetical protein
MNLLTKDMMPELLVSMKEPAYHSTCPRTALTLTISKIRYFLKPVKKPETIPPSETFRVRGYNTTRTICST